MLTLESKIEELPRIGPVYQKKLAKIGIKTVRDLLWYFPARYEDFSKICPIVQVKLNEKCCICGTILDIKTQRTWKRKMYITEALVADKTAAIEAIWFNQPYLTRTLKKGDELCLAGKVTLGKDGVFLSSPSYERVSGEEISQLKHTARLVPVYPETTGISSRWLRYIIKPVLENLKNKIPETLPPEIIRQEELLKINEAIEQIHFPDLLDKAEKAKARFAFEGLFMVELSVLKARFRLNQQRSPAIPFDVELIKKFVSGLPFKLTDAQRKCAYQILKDLERHCPMSRLLEGDVGSGKTIVAVLASLNVVKAGFQVALMSPTEILAKQHFKEVSRFLWPKKVKIALLTGKQDQIISQKLKNELIEISRTKLLEKTKKGEIDILIGTHALIQDKVKFGNLGLAIIDEQHRFGLEQRARLCQGYGGQARIVQTPKQKYNKTVRSDDFVIKYIPHLLSMTATPIPRTLALTVYGDLDLSIIDEMPKGRKRVITKVVPPEGRESAYEFIRKEVREGKQVFVICPRIESGIKNQESGIRKDALGWAEAKAVKEEYGKLSRDVFPDLKVAMLHGKMKTKEKEKIMKDFKAKKTDILVSTSVVEVGVDVPNATVMFIEGAERFGLAQLHQFRGRVGRSDMQSWCFLFTDSPAKKTRQRLEAIVKAKNGFELAQKDLEIRGPGSLFGAKQWGLPDLAMEALKNLPLVEKTRQTAKELLLKSPNLREYPFLQNQLKGIEKQLHLE